MILIEAVEGDFKLEDVVDLKVAELKEMQKKNPVVNFAVFNNPDKTEYIVDFILSRGKKRLNLIEWNAYKYKLFVDSSFRIPCPTYSLVIDPGSFASKIPWHGILL